MLSIAVSQTDGSRPCIKRHHFAVSAGLLIAGLLYGSWLPFQIRDISFDDGLRLFRAVLSAGLSTPFSRQDVIVNVLVGIPISFALLGSMLCGMRGFVRHLLAVVAAAALTIGVSIVAELGQVWVDGRVPSFRDIVSQSTGSAIGILLWLFIGRRLSRTLDGFLYERQRSTRLETLFNLYTIGFVIWSLLPFDLVTSVQELAHKLTNGEIEILPFSFPYATRQELVHALLFDTLLYVPIGLWATLTSRRSNSRVRNGWSSLLLAALLTVSVEAAQLLIRGRFSSTTDVLFGLTGSLVGILIAQGISRRAGLSETSGRESLLQNPGFWGVSALAYSVFLLIVFWIPIEKITQNGDLIRDRLHQFADLPFRRLQEFTPGVAMVFVVIRNFAWFVPLGVVCAGAVRCATSTARRSWFLQFLGFSYIASLGLAIELGHVVMPSRVADLTEVLIRMAGGTCGLILGMLVFRFRPTQSTEC